MDDKWIITLSEAVRDRDRGWRVTNDDVTVVVDGNDKTTGVLVPPYTLNPP